MLNIEAHPFMS